MTRKNSKGNQQKPRPNTNWMDPGATLPRESKKAQHGTGTYSTKKCTLWRIQQRGGMLVDTGIDSTRNLSHLICTQRVDSKFIVSFVRHSSTTFCCLLARLQMITVHDLHASFTYCISLQHDRQIFLQLQHTSAFSRSTGMIVCVYVQ